LPFVRWTVHKKKHIKRKELMLCRWKIYTTRRFNVLNFFIMSWPGILTKYRTITKGPIPFGSISAKFDFSSYPLNHYYCYQKHPSYFILALIIIIITSYSVRFGFFRYIYIVVVSCSIHLTDEDLWWAVDPSRVEAFHWHSWLRPFL
jgi:hypothetical protein